MAIKEILKQKRADLMEKDTIAVDYCVLNNDKTLDVIRLMQESQRSAYKPENILVIQDQIIPPNSPEVSLAQQMIMQFAEREGTGYCYGAGMASHILLDEYVKSGDVVVSGDRDILMVGAAGAMGICLGSAKLAQAVVYGKVIIPEPVVLSVKLTGQLRQDSDIRAAAMTLVTALTELVSPATVVEFYPVKETGLSQDECAILCGWMQKTGAMSALIVRESSRETDCQFDLGEISGPSAAESSASVLEVKAVFIGGAYGGYLEDIKQTAEYLRGRKLAFKVRLTVAPATSRIYAEAANRGYLADIMAAGGMIINQCGNPAVQARIGDGEVMVSNDIHNESGYAGPASSNIRLVTTRQAVLCALNGMTGEGGDNGRDV